MRQAGLLVTCLLILATGSPRAKAEGETSAIKTRTQSACTRGESWTLSPEIPKDLADTLRQTTTGSLPPVRGFSEALALRRFSQTPQGKAFGEYWISRALFESKLFHTAKDGFSALASRTPTAETSGIQVAALQCLARIADKYPSISISDDVFKQLPEYQKLAETPFEKKVVWDLASVFFRNYLNEGREPGEIERAAALLKGSGAEESFAKGVWEAKFGRHAAAITDLDAFLASPDPGMLKKHRDVATILLARSYYTRGDYPKAAATLKKIPKSSNFLALSLEELSWANLLDERYPEAIGNALGLQAGGMRKTYAPEAQMVMAMAMNELCQYPESVKAINGFRKNYESSFRWLNNWEHGREHSRPDHLYPKAIDFVRKKSDVPVKIGTEWIRSPLFTSSQDEINLLFDEKDGATAVEKTGGSETRRLSMEILKFAQALKPKYRVAKIQQTAGKPMPKSILSDLDRLRKLVVTLNRLQQAAPVWKIILRNSQGQVPGIQNRLITAIDDDLTHRTFRMLRQLDEIAENLQLVEVEIYNGASEDIIWQNAHPEYRKIAKDMKSDSKGEAEKVWNWGRAPASADGDEEGEIWEDELDSFKADLFDNCSSKDKYLALRYKRR